MGEERVEGSGPGDGTCSATPTPPRSAPRSCKEGAEGLNTLA